MLARVGQSVERYHAGLFGLAFVESLRVEELREDMTPKKTREFVFDCVVLRENLSDDEGDYYAETVRRLKTLDGRAAKKGDEAKHDTVASYGEALNFLLPRNQKLYEFKLSGEETLEGRRALRIELFRPGDDEPSVEWKGTSFRVTSAPTRWTFWVDASSFDVLRVESHLEAPFEFENPNASGAGPFGRFGPARKLRYAREDYAASFRRVRLADTNEAPLVPESAEWVRRVELKDPAETRLVPETSETVLVIEGASHPRTRRATRFSDYRRFRSDVKIVEEPGP